MRLIFSLVLLSSSGCAIQQIPDAASPKPLAPAVKAEEQPPLAIPQPPAHLPKPYASASIQPGTAEEKEYANYLWSTTMLPNQALCDQNLSMQMQSTAKSGSVKREWVTKPFLAWGGIWKKGAVVGPVQYLYAITEAHVTWQDQQGLERKSTYSCYVQYALQRETAVWRQGHLKYGSYTSEGHKKYASGPASAPFAVAPPDPDSGWEPGIRYYRAE